LNSKVTVKNFW